MASAASAFLAGLTEDQRGLACFPFGDERRDWSFYPIPDRSGLPLGVLDDGQRRLAHELIVTGTSLPGYAKVVSVIAMEHVRRVLVPDLAGLFNPERYCFKVFGAPGDDVWGWQFAGHHVSLNFAIVKSRYVSPTPACSAPRPPVTDCSRRWPTTRNSATGSLNSLDDAQRRAAIINHRPPPEIVARLVPRIGEIERPDAVFWAEPGLRDRRGRMRPAQLRPRQSLRGSRRPT